MPFSDSRRLTLLVAPPCCRALSPSSPTTVRCQSPPLSPHRCHAATVSPAASPVARRHPLSMRVPIVKTKRCIGQHYAIGHRSTTSALGIVTAPWARAYCAADMGQLGDLAAGPGRSCQALGQILNPTLLHHFLFLKSIFISISRKWCKLLKYKENGIKLRKIQDKFYWNPL
jgi:hypothetical protein